MSKQYYCPDCNNPLEELSGCATVGYFCNSCKKLVSKKKILPEQESEAQPENSAEVIKDQE